MWVRVRDGSHHKFIHVDLRLTAHGECHKLRDIVWEQRDDTLVTCLLCALADSALAGGTSRGALDETRWEHASHRRARELPAEPGAQDVRRFTPEFTCGLRHRRDPG